MVFLSGRDGRLEPRKRGHGEERTHKVKLNRTGTWYTYPFSGKNFFHEKAKKIRKVGR